LKYLNLSPLPNIAKSGNMRQGCCLSAKPNVVEVTHVYRHTLIMLKAGTIVRVFYFLLKYL